MTSATFLQINMADTASVLAILQIILGFLLSAFGIAERVFFGSPNIISLGVALGIWVSKIYCNYSKINGFSMARRFDRMK